jgi:hypothetical protein
MPGCPVLWDARSATFTRQFKKLSLKKEITGECRRRPSLPINSKGQSIMSGKNNRNNKSAKPDITKRNTLALAATVATFGAALGIRGASAEEPRKSMIRRAPRRGTTI